MMMLFVLLAILLAKEALEISLENLTSYVFFPKKMQPNFTTTK